MNEQCGTQSNSCKRMSWSAVFAGALVGIGLSFLLNLLSVAIGLSIVSTTNEGAATIATGGLIGILIGTVIAGYFGGYAAGYLGRPFCQHRNIGILYGFVAWCLALILTAILATNIGRYVASYSNFVAGPAIVVVENTAPAGKKEMSAPKATAAETKGKKEAKVMQAAEMNQAKENKAVVHGLASASMLIFILFLVGAISSALGGHCGVRGCSSSCAKQ